MCIRDRFLLLSVYLCHKRNIRDAKIKCSLHQCRKSFYIKATFFSKPVERSTQLMLQYINYLYLIGPAFLVFLLIWIALRRICLLYTSDAADEEDSVDLGGRRIIKKKKNRRINA